MNKEYIIKDILNFILIDGKINQDALSSDLIKNKDKILKYLNNGYKVSTVSTIQQCEICNKPAGPINYFSDGYWIWPKWLNHYLTEHNIKFPKKFLERMELNNYNIDKNFVRQVLEDDNTILE
ncbi:hypothetical protein ACSIGC_03370 [Tenacibaculum sp. ZS6-P6]|uniref:hypothetical protein n=1 Tax=Tenacibaculum sp. ZS6-P6 TaxID=3447503 RepID=UPI003F98BAE0